jgi:hypothetical protein
MSDLSLHKLILTFTGVLLVNSSASQDRPDWRGSNLDATWSHSAFVNRYVFGWNDNRLIFACPVE